MLIWSQRGYYSPSDRQNASEGIKEAGSVLVGGGEKNPVVTESIRSKPPLHEACVRLLPKTLERLVDRGSGDGHSVEEGIVRVREYPTDRVMNRSLMMVAEFCRTMISACT